MPVVKDAAPRRWTAALCNCNGFEPGQDLKEKHILFYVEALPVLDGTWEVDSKAEDRERGMSLLCEVLMTRLFQFWFATVCIFRYSLLCTGLSL